MFFFKFLFCAFIIVASRIAAAESTFKLLQLALNYIIVPIYSKNSTTNGTWLTLTVEISNYTMENGRCNIEPSRKTYSSTIIIGNGRIIVSGVGLAVIQYCYTAHFLRLFLLYTFAFISPQYAGVLLVGSAVLLFSPSASPTTITISSSAPNAPESSPDCKKTHSAVLSPAYLFAGASRQSSRPRHISPSFPPFLLDTPPPKQFQSIFSLVFPCYTRYTPKLPLIHNSFLTLCI